MDGCIASILSPDAFMLAQNKIGDESVYASQLRNRSFRLSLICCVYYEVEIFEAPVICSRISIRRFCTTVAAAAAAVAYLGAGHTAASSQLSILRREKGQSSSSQIVSVDVDDGHLLPVQSLRLGFSMGFRVVGFGAGVHAVVGRGASCWYFVAWSRYRCGGESATSLRDFARQR